MTGPQEHNKTTKVKHNDRGSILVSWAQTIGAYLIVVHIKTSHKQKQRQIKNEEFRYGIIKNDVEDGEENKLGQ